MDETSKITATVAAAAKAAGEGDYDAAERHLREVVVLQEASFGPVHPDLANTLNNLGVACEHAGRLDAAEDSYRRAYAIAQRAFASDHPFVIRSAENLRDFCEARGRPFDLPVPTVVRARPDAPVAGARPVAPGVATRPVAPAAVSRPDAPVAASRPVVPVVGARLPLAETPLIQLESPPYRVDAPARPARFLPVLLVAGVAAALLAWWLWPVIVPAIAPVPETTSAEAPPAPAANAQPEPAPPEPESVPAEQETTPADAETVAPETPIASAEAVAPPPSTSAVQPGPEAPRVARVAGSVAVVRAEVCRNFLPRGNQWRCDVVDSTTAPGELVFFTRIRSPKPARIEHYWYRGNELIQRVELRVGANAGEGYRTYSRNTVTAAGAGQWRVELRAGGAVLHEEQFTVVAR